jgi:hypothetical protein
LAKKFQQFIYGTTLNELNKSREALIEFHIESINYCNDALNVESIRFFDLMQDFTIKLNNNDKKQILAYLNKQPVAKKANKNEKLWQSFFDYRDSLIALSHEAAASVIATTSETVQPITNKTIISKSKTASNVPVLSSTVLNPPGSSMKRKLNLSEISSIEQPMQPQETKSNSTIEITRKRSRSPDDVPVRDDSIHNVDENDDSSDTTNTAVDSTIKSFDATLTLIAKENDVPTPKRIRVTRSSVASNSKVSEPTKPSFISAIL